MCRTERLTVFALTTARMYRIVTIKNIRLLNAQRALVSDRKTKTGGLVYDHAWDAIMYLEQRTEFWRQEQPPTTKVRKRDKTPVTTEKMRVNNWVSREVDKIDYGESVSECKCVDRALYTVVLISVAAAVSIITRTA